MKVALVTGAMGGIGYEICRRLYNGGFAVAAVYHRDRAKEQEFMQNMPGAKLYRCDMRDFVQIKQLYKEILADFGKIDLVVNNAGISHSGLLQDMDGEEIDNVIMSNLSSVIYSCRMAAQFMAPHHEGNIINISSVWGICGASCEAVYSAAKGGVITFTKALAKELGPAGIRVNCISPGVIKTKMLDCYTQQDLDLLAQETPLGKLGTAKDVAKAVCFLSSEECAFITGHNLTVDGGFSL